MFQTGGMQSKCSESHLMFCDNIWWLFFVTDLQLANKHKSTDVKPAAVVTNKPKVLFISYKFVKGFLAITFLFLVISSWNFHDVCQRFLYNQKRNFSWIRQKMRNFPKVPRYKEILHVISSWNFHDVCLRFLYNQKQNFSFIRQKEISP